MKIRLLIVLFYFILQIPSIAQKPTYTFTLKVYVNEATAQYYGGHTAIENLIKDQFVRVNQFYNSESRFNAVYNFVPSAFSYFSENGPNQDVLNSIAFSSPETNYSYRILYSRTPYGGNHPNIIGDYNVFYRSIRFALNAEAEWNQTLFGTIPTRILSHELGHSRGALDLYAGNVDGANNQIYNGVSYDYPVLSIMNYLYNLTAAWDTHSIGFINSSGSALHTETSWRNLFWSKFPSQFSIRVKDQSGNPIVNAKVTLYGVQWLSTSINSADAFVYYTDAQGKVTFDGTNISLNPFRDAGGTASFFSNFMVVVETQGEGQYNWMPVYDVQNAKINGQNEYFLDYSFNVVSTGCTAPTWSATAVYTAGSVVQFNGMKYTAWYWTQGQQPDLNYGAQATGKPWNQNGPCGSSTCTAPLWNSSTAYTAGSVVQLNGLKYSAWYWTQNQDPSLNYGTQSSGKPWNLLGTCTSKAGLLSQSSSMEIHPNPASSQLTISLDAPAEDEVKIIVYDMLSRQVMEKENTIFSGQNDLSIDVSDLNTGLYTLSISNGNDRIVKQFVISK